MFGWVWLPILFPSIGVMFALAGSLIAGSLDRSPGNPWRVLKKRTIRLLPPVWLFGLVVVPVMLLAGWTNSETSGVPLSWQTLLFWILPISDPPASTFGDDWVTPLWYIRTYLWFLLLSPALLWLFRHWPKRLLAIPVSVVLLSALGVLPLEGRSGDVILSTCMFGGCWMLGFAHHDNRIRRLPLSRVLLGGAALMGLGLAWAFTHQNPVTSWDIDNIPLADTLYCLGAVLILLRLYPDFSWMDRRVVLDKLVTVINSRAMTIYLWGNFAIFLGNPILDSWTVTANLDQDNAVGWIQKYLASWIIIIGAVFIFGWCEDLAARRPLRFNPWPRSKQQLETMRVSRTFFFPRPPRMAELTPKRLFVVTACLVATAGTVSAMALAGTHTPGRANAGDVPSRYAANPRVDTKRPANLGQGNTGSSAVVGPKKSYRPATTKRTPFPFSPSIANRAAPSTVLSATQTGFPQSRGVLAPVPTKTKAPAPGSTAPAPGPTAPAPGPTAPAPGPTAPVPGPTAPVPGPTAPAPGHTAPAPGPTAPAPGSTAPPPPPATIPAPPATTAAPPATTPAPPATTQAASGPTQPASGPTQAAAGPTLLSPTALPTPP